MRFQVQLSQVRLLLNIRHILVTLYESLDQNLKYDTVHARVFANA